MLVAETQGQQRECFSLPLDRRQDWRRRRPRTSQLLPSAPAFLVGDFHHHPPPRPSLLSCGRQEGGEGSTRRNRRHPGQEGNLLPPPPPKSRQVSPRTSLARMCHVTPPGGGELVISGTFPTTLSSQFIGPGPSISNCLLKGEVGLVYFHEYINCLKNVATCHAKQNQGSAQ